MLSSVTLVLHWCYTGVALAVYASLMSWCAGMVWFSNWLACVALFFFFTLWDSQQHYTVIALVLHWCNTGCVRNAWVGELMRFGSVIGLLVLPFSSFLHYGTLNTGCVRKAYKWRFDEQLTRCCPVLNPPKDCTCDVTFEVVRFCILKRFWGLVCVVFLLRLMYLRWVRQRCAAVCSVEIVLAGMYSSGSSSLAYECVICEWRLVCKPVRDGTPCAPLTGILKGCLL